MLLSPSERILLLNILPPAEGNALLLRGVRRLRASLSFTDEEIRDWKIASPAPGHFTFDESAAKGIEVGIDGPVKTYVAECLQSADAAGRLHEKLLSVYDQFFPEG